MTLSDNKRPWSFLVMVALSVGLPVGMGAWRDQFALGILGGMGGMGGLVMLYMPQTSTPHRLTTLGLCAFGFSVSFTLGLAAFFATIVSRHFAMPPPGSFFFVLVACLGRTLPFDLSLAPARSYGLNAIILQHRRRI
ncbi:hypothetical protein [Marinobacterium sedimentorum]|uniref:hypothetical protein n=1 Tax=Marinobacterium sedimentorum TaxID=2927804 RepID=UPI0020C6C077|nr:hypothetical protein [Marinobacterium sedimentorum]MCP8688731.1 hypothetical protein [Marinobacterium sedimentorum]